MNATVRGARPGGQIRILELALPPAWVADALCAQTAPDAFFPEKGEPAAPAKRICAACAVRAECLAWALETRQAFGIWGGLSARQRQRLRKHITATTEQGRAAA